VTAGSLIFVTVFLALKATAIAVRLAWQLLLGWQWSQARMAGRPRRRAPTTYASTYTTDSKMTRPGPPLAHRIRDEATASSHNRPVFSHVRAVPV
jgi:hypothetical protein